MLSMQEIMTLAARCTGDYLAGFDAAKAAIAEALELDAERLKRDGNFQQAASLHAAAIVARSTEPK
jgi:hypothetical protein